MSWHYVEGTTQKGPVSDSDLATLAANGGINDNTLVWREGMAEWLPYGQTKSPAQRPAGGVTCAECGQVFSPSDVIRHGDVYICANCKPVFVQKLKEGIAPKAGLNYAGFSVRGGSIILDGIIIYVVSLPLTLFVFPRLLGVGGVAVAVGFVVNTAIAATYYVFFLGKYGATPGKMANKLRVVNPDGSNISYGKALGRYFAANWISGMFTLCIGYLLAIWDDEKRALHDRICSTRVVRK